MRDKPLDSNENSDRKAGITRLISPILPPLSKRALGRILQLDQLDKIYQQTLLMGVETPFMKNLLDVMKVTFKISERDLEAIPCQGPVIVSANHPFGGIDGIILAAILGAARSDAKVMANFLLGKIPELKNIFILVDPFDTHRSTSANFRPMREAVGWLQNGGMVGMFPAGEVSHIKWNRWRVTDPQWSDMVARLVKRTGASVLPTYFSGSNSLIFQVAGLVHPRLRTVMLPRELLKKTNEKIELRIGKLIPFEKLNRFQSNEDMVKYLRFRTYMLAHRQSGNKNGLNGYEEKWVDDVDRTNRNHHDPGFLDREIKALPPEQLLVDSDKFCVYQAQAHQIPHVLQEIGVLREITFREVGEGTGKPVDIDHFDEYYTHLFVWNKQEMEIVGGYRLGLADRILKSHGIEGLYTYTLFHYGSRFLDQINPAIELGRSFVRQKYQRTYHALMLLWKGIGRIVARNPEYKILFGPVSITREYDPISQRLIVAFLKEYNHREDLARLVKPRNPLKKSTSIKSRELEAPLTLLQDIQALSEMISDIEEDQKGVPILLKQYVKLGGKSLGFNVDESFSNALDSLILVDLTQTDRRILERYVGKEGVSALLRNHKTARLADCA